MGTYRCIKKNNTENKVVSPPQLCVHGVTKGSASGPHLFLTCTSDLLWVIKNAKVRHFADNLNLNFGGSIKLIINKLIITL